jgi:hypothetical protein
VFGCFQRAADKAEYSYPCLRIFVPLFPNIRTLISEYLYPYACLCLFSARGRRGRGGGARCSGGGALQASLSTESTGREYSEYPVSTQNTGREYSEYPVSTQSTDREYSEYPCEY